MLDFGDLANLDKRNMEALLREIDVYLLGLALMNAPEGVKANVFANMPEGAGESRACG